MYPPIVGRFLIVIGASFLSLTHAHASLFDNIQSRARLLSEQPFIAPEKNLPDSLASLDYDQYRAIRFRSEAAIWKNESAFEVQLFHPGFLYQEPVTLHQVNGSSIIPLSMKPEWFDYAPPADMIPDTITEPLGVAGFRLHYPINRKQYADEFLVFQGASYFRLLGPDLVYGLSARGLAINTAEPEGEEFPVFREFWLQKPTKKARNIVIYALMDSPSLTGAYRFDVRPGTPTEMHVEANLYARHTIKKLGIAPLTSMYMWGENHTRFVDDFRPEVHDSDGLLMAASNGEWIWRPLDNHRHLRVSSLLDNNPKGFGVLQRDRHFDHYLDSEARYEKRPSLWVTPQGDWGSGRVELVEIPSDSETNDNIVAYWVPDTPLREKGHAQYRYTLRATDDVIRENTLAKVIRTRNGWGANPGQADPPPQSVRRMVVDFQGGNLTRAPRNASVNATLQLSAGTYQDLQVTPLPDSNIWRATFLLTPDDEKPADMRLFLHLGDQRVSEVWSYVWYPDAH
jgi:glucans biosynthesis protein